VADVTLNLGALPQARAHVQAIVDHIETDPMLSGAKEPFWVYLVCVRILCASEDARAEQILERAHGLL
jgi:hypothetical protein